MGLVSYHVRVLAEAGLVELAGMEPKRGALQHFYRATGLEPVGATLMLTEEAADQLDADIRAALTRARAAGPGEHPVIVVVHRDPT